MVRTAVQEEFTSISERSRERWFLLLSALVLLLACVSPQRLARVPWPFAEDPSRILFVAVMVAGAPAALVMELLIEVAAAVLRGRVPRLGLMLKHPAAMATSASPEPVDASVARVAQRLAALGFTHETHVPSDRPDGVVVRASKLADPSQQAFLDHKFEAVVMLCPSARGPGTDVAATVTQLDTILIDTGERERLRRMAEHLCLGAEILAVPTVPLTAYAALVLAWAPLLWLTFARPRETSVEADVLSACSFGAAAMGVLAAVLIFRKRDRLFGLRVVAAAVVLAATPFVVKLATTWHTLLTPRHVFVLTVLPLFAAMMTPIFVGELRLRRRHAAGTAGGLVRRVVSRVCIYGSALTIFFLGTAAMIYRDARAITEQRAADVRDLEQGARPPSRWLKLRGVVDVDRAITKAPLLSDPRHYHIPLVSETDHNPVFVVLMAGEGDLDDEALSGGAMPVEVEGLDLDHAMDEETRKAFSDEGTEIAEGAIEVEYKQTPQGFARRAGLAVWIGLPLAAVIAVVHLAARLSDRRRSARPQTTPASNSPEPAARR